MYPGLGNTHEAGQIPRSSDQLVAATRYFADKIKQGKTRCVMATTILAPREKTKVSFSTHKDRLI